MDNNEKFLRKLDSRQRLLLLKILADIKMLDLKAYSIKPLKGFKGLFRLKKGKIRVIFRKEGGQGVVFHINYRKDAYKNL